jgi:hypothetical protein
MGSEFTFYDYIDDSGTNVIAVWLNGDGYLAKAFFTNLIPQLESSPPHRFQGSIWKEPHTKPLKNKKGENWEGFIELRKTGKIQYRLIAKIQDRKVFLVTCGVHKGQNYYTDVAPQTAWLRVDQMINNPAKYRREHEFD